MDTNTEQNMQGMVGTDMLPPLQNQWPTHYNEDDINAIKIIHRWLSSNDAMQNGKPRTKAALARAANVKDSTFSQVLSGKYTSNPTRFLDAALDFLERETHRDITKVEIPLCKTSVYTTVLLVCQRAHQHRDFGIISGQKGVGKTFALKHYAATTPSAVLIEGMPQMTPTMFLSQVVNQLKIAVEFSSPLSRSRGGTKDEKMMAIIKYFKSKDALLILDEAEKVNANTLEHVRRISDLAEVGCVLSGAEELRGLVKSIDGRHGQISSRVGFWPELIQGISKKDANLIVTTVLENYGYETNAKLNKAFWDMSEAKARVLAKLLRNLIEMGLRKGHTLSANLIVEMGKQAMGIQPPKESK